MKTKILIALLCLFPLFTLAQNYEQQGDELYAQAQYEKAIKKYNAAAELNAAGSQVSQKIQNSKQCILLCRAAVSAESTNAYSKALDIYTQLYKLNSIPLYKEKITLYERKITEVEQARLQKEAVERQKAEEAEQRRREEQQRRKAEKEELSQWESACKHSTIDSYNAFLNKYPQSKNKTEALKKISELKDKQNWEIARRVNTIDAYMKYINDGGTNTHKAETAIDRLYLQQASKIDEIEAYQKYLSRETNVPKAYEDLANDRIDQIRKQTKLIEIAETSKNKKQAYDKVQEARKLGVLQSKLVQRALILEEPYAYELARSKDAPLATKQKYCSRFKSVAPQKHIENINKQIEKFKKS